MNIAPTLDHRYLNYAERTAEAFARFPQLEPLRYFVFRELLIQRRSYDAKRTVKHWIRPLLRSRRTASPLPKCDVLIWIEGARSIISDTVLPVARQLMTREERVQLLSFNGSSDLPEGTVAFRCPAASRIPVWAASGWSALKRAEPGLDQSNLERSFVYESANTDSLLLELTRLLKEMQPRVVVTASTQLMGGAALMTAARTLGFKTVLLQHGLLQPLYVPILADAMCTWGPSSSDTLARLGIDSRKLVALGSPRHDGMAPSKGGLSRRALLEALSLQDKPTLVFFSNGNDLLRNGSAPAKSADWLEAVAKRYRNELNVVVRLHPNEEGSLYRHCSHVVITKDGPAAHVLLDGCDWVASICSTALHEALLYRKPVLQFCAEGWPDLADNWKSGLARRVASQEEICAIVEDALAAGIHHGPEPEIVERVFSNHGRAGQAIADFLISECRPNERRA